MTKYEELQEYLKNNQTTWLISGVAGFIGSNLLEKLLVLNQKVIGLDNFDTGYQKNIDEAPAAIIYSLEGVFAAGAGWIILNQILDLNNILGCFLILFAVLLSQLAPSLKRSSVSN